METSQNQFDYPYADLSIECPEKSDRLVAFFRIFMVLPVLFLFVLIVGFQSEECAVAGGGFLFLPILLSIVFRYKYPRVWFDWVLYLTKFMARITAYLFLLRDEYPAIEDEQQVKLTLRYPDTAAELHRGMPLVKWFLDIPHYIVLMFLFVAVLFVTLFAWFSILFTGKYPPEMHRFTVSVFRWSLRVDAYAFLLLTDRYPPFQLN
ncbi:MAG: DUF4389 domain-containing protein [Fibrobacter sp.]|nr:DUF4389 domain-containing protein [Fibrobacter sp.]